MEYSFKNIYSKARAALETDRYIIYQTLKSKLYYSGNYLLIKQEPSSIDDLEYYIAACRNFFKEKGVNFVHIATPENSPLPRKFKKYLKKAGFTEINLDLYNLDIEDFVEHGDSNYHVEYLQRIDLNKYLKFQYNVDLESSNEEWAEHNQGLLYEDIRSENIKQLVAKDGDKIIGAANIIVKDTFFEIDNLYVNKEYRNQGVAMHLINHAIRTEKKDNVLLVADENDTPKYMYEKIGFRKIAQQDFYLNSKL